MSPADVPPAFIVDAPISSRQHCAMVKVVALAMSQRLVMYDLTRANVMYSESTVPGDPEVTSPDYWRREFGFSKPPTEAVARRWKSPNCKIKASAKGLSGVNLTFYRPALTKNGREGLIVVSSGLGMTEHLPGVVSNQRFPTFVCRLKRKGGRWIAESCSNNAQKLF